MTNSQADRKIKKLLDDMARNGSTFTSTEDLMKPSAASLTSTENPKIGKSA